MPSVWATSPQVAPSSLQSAKSSCLGWTQEYNAYLIIIYIYIHISIYLSIYLSIYAGMHVCMYACMHACMYACMHVCMYACMHVCTYVCMYACIRIFIYLYICIYECIYIYTCVHVHACVYYIYVCVGSALRANPAHVFTSLAVKVPAGQSVAQRMRHRACDKNTPIKVYKGTKVREAETHITERTPLYTASHRFEDVAMTSNFVLTFW